MHEFNFERKMMGSELTVAVIADTHENAWQAFDRMCAIGDAFETRFSRFLPESELSRLNTQKDADVSPEFLEITQRAAELFAETNGIFNSLAQIQALGYTKDFARLADEEITTSSEAYDSDFSKVRIDPRASHITLQPTHQLDFGGFLKGHVAELMARSCEKCAGCIVNLGGDIATRGHDEHGDPFVFAIYNPVTDTHVLPRVVEDGCIATSGTYKRTWVQNGTQTHHILNPATRQNPDSDVISATTVHHDGYRADAYATVALILGSQKAPEFLESRGIPFALITTSGNVVHSYDFV
jgi:thiamine biosynthesis lipoprotein